MKRQADVPTVEFSISPHGQRPGWQVARIVYNAGRADHRAQVDAALVAMVNARSPEGEKPRELAAV
jgi:hypothetical protein